jgi:TP901 family phage tail tape measure protein
MSEKISFVLDATVKGTKDIVSTTTATERLTAALEEQRSEVKSLNTQLREVKGFDSASSRAAKLAKQVSGAKASMNALGIEMEENKQKTSRLRGEYGITQAEIRSLNQQMKKASGEGAQQLKLKFNEANKRLESLNAEIHHGKVRTTELGAAYKKASGRVDSLTERQTKQQNRLQSLGDALKKAGVSTDKLGNEQKRLESQTEKSTAALEKQNRRLKEMQTIQGRIDARKAKLGEIGSQATSLAMAAAPLAGTMWSAMKNESSFADVSKVVDMTPEQSSQLRSWALKTSTDTPMSANDINAMLAAGGQSGIQDINELKSFVLDSAKMGVAFDMEAGQAGETLAVFKAAMGLDQQDALGLAGLANHLSNNSNSKAKDIAGVMSREGATAKTAGFSVNESAALASAMLSTGMGEERTATALKNISGRLTLGDAASGTQKKAMTALGLDTGDVASSMQQDASGTLLEVLEAIKDAPIEEQSALISQIFGEEAKGAVAALAGNTQNFTKALKLAKQGQDVHIESLQKEYETRVSTSENGVDMFVNKVSRLSVVIGTALLPALNWVLEPLGKGVDMLADFAEANQTVTAAVGIGVAAFIGLKGVLLAGKAASLIFGNTLDKSRLFRKGLNRETKEGGRIAAMAAKRWRSLNAVVGSSRGTRQSGISGGARGERSSRRKRRGRGLSGLARSVMDNRFVQPKGAALAMAGSGIAMMPMSAMAADAIEIGGDVADSMGKVGLSRVLKPLGLTMNAVSAAEGIATGNMEQSGEALGDIGGSLGGGALGAAIGTMILPGIGTAIGGLLGSIGGGIGGEMLGGWFGRKLDSPEKTAAKVDAVQQKEAQARQQPQVTFSPQIQITGAQGQDEQVIAKEITRQMDQQFSYLMGENTLSTQLGYAAIDRDS